MSADHPKILLVEDNQDHAEIFIRSLKKNQVNCQITHLNDGEKALVYLFGTTMTPESIPLEKPDLILLDLRLPKIDGLEVLENIKKSPHLNMVPVIILTSSSAESDIAKAYNHNANSYVVKPLDYPRFVEMVSQLGGYWLKFNTNAPK